MSKNTGHNPKSKENRKKGKTKYADKESRYLTKSSGKKKVSDGAAGLPKRIRNNQGQPLPKFDDKIRLNKYLSNAGICSRREADTLIASGTVSVNGEVVTELGYKVNPTDNVKYDGAAVKQDIKRYILVNKPREFSLKYSEDPSKKSVYQLIKKATKEVLMPVGKMDRKTCGLILYTNDGDMEKKLTHPKFKVSQLYHVVLKDSISEEDLDKLMKGVFIDNNMFSAEEASFISGKSHNEIGIKIFSHKSNKVALMLGKIGHEIVKLDRVEFAGLDKKDLPRGHYRSLSSKEVSFLKMS